MPYDPPPDRPRYAFHPNPAKPGAVFLHCPPQIAPFDWRQEIQTLPILAALAMMLGVVGAVIPGVVVAALGWGWDGFLMCLSAGATLANVVGLVALATDYGARMRRRGLARLYPQDLLELASARVFTHWLTHAPTRTLDGGPYRVELSWEVSASGLALCAFALENKDPDEPEEWETRLIVPRDSWPADLDRPTWADLGVPPGPTRARMERWGGRLAYLVPAVCLTAPLHLASAHQRLPLLGALHVQSQTVPAQGRDA